MDHDFSMPKIVNGNKLGTIFILQRTKEMMLTQYRTLVQLVIFICIIFLMKSTKFIYEQCSPGECECGKINK